VQQYAGEPKGVEAPARSAGGAAFAVWLKEGARFAVTLYGSSSCPPTVDTFEVTGGNEVKLTRAKVTQKACTADYAPFTSVFATPSAIRIGSPVKITVVSADGTGDPTKMVLPPYGHD